jgi:hypothetical protein
VSGKSRAPVVAIALLLTLVLYVLSAIPVMWLAVHAYIPVWVTSIYDPIFLIPPLKRFILWVLEKLLT